MLNTYQEMQDFRRMLETFERNRQYGRIRESLMGLPELCERSRGVNTDGSTYDSPGEIDTNRFSVRELFEVFVPHGRELVNAMNPRHARGGVMMEAAGATQTAQFSNILGQVAYGDVLDNWNAVGFFGDQLHTTRAAQTQQREMVPGVTMIGDQAGAIGENEEYPVVTVGEQYITQPAKVKHGFQVNVTEETIWEDKYSMVQSNLMQGTDALRIKYDTIQMNNALGITNTYSRNGGPQQDTYANSHTQGDFDNLLTGTPLVDYTSIEAALLLFEDMTDPDTGQPIMLSNNLQLVVPGALRARAHNILYGNGISQGAIDADTPRTHANNPIASMPATFSLLSSSRVKFVTGSASTWYIGDFRQAFDYREVFPLGLFVQDRNSEAGFARDVVMSAKVRVKGAAGVRKPQCVVKCTA